MKKTRLGERAEEPAPGVSGRRARSAIGSNIGAGTITCNYDGEKKHETRSATGAFIGSNSTLVAPVEIGEESYIGAGSVITDAVPDQALALGRGRQVVKTGWVAEDGRRKST